MDKQIDILKNKDDKIGKVEGDPAAVRAKETLIEVLYSKFETVLGNTVQLHQISVVTNL